MESNYLESVKSEFTKYKSLAEKAMAQVDDDKLFWQYNPESNSIAIIVNHLWGNMLSRWTNFLVEDGEKTWRKRDEEFESVIKTKEELLSKWNAGWTCLFAALDSLTQDDLSEKIFIREEPLTVLDAINRQLSHYSSHVGQIIFLAKMIVGNSWESLSIAKKKSS